MNLPYTIELQRDPEDAWFVQVKELRGCMSQGDTAEEALAMIQEAMPLWLEVALEDDLPIPEPRPNDDYSGKFVVRVPRSLHRQLVEAAADDGVSLNQYINVVLARAVGRPEPAVRPSHRPVEQAVPHLSLPPSSLYTQPSEAARVLHEAGAGYVDTADETAADESRAPQHDSADSDTPG
jgi:antitoxin HicB